MKEIEYEKNITFLFIMAGLFTVTGCSSNKENTYITSSDKQNNIPVLNDEYYRSFSLDIVLHSRSLGDIHYNVMVPKEYEILNLKHKNPLTKGKISNFGIIEKYLYA